VEVGGVAEYVDVEYWEETEEELPHAPEPEVGTEAGVVGSILVAANGWIGARCLGDVDMDCWTGLLDCWQKSCWTFQSINSTPERASS